MTETPTSTAVVAAALGWPEQLVRELAIYVAVDGGVRPSDDLVEALEALLDDRHIAAASFDVSVRLGQSDTDRATAAAEWHRMFASPATGRARKRP